MNEPTRRLFIALWPDAAVRSSIDRATREIAAASGGRVIPSVNFHITLVFLGAIAESRVSALIDCIWSEAIVPFELFFGHVTWWERQQVLCLEPLSGQDAVVSLVDRLRLSLRTEGFGVETRSFRTHITLAREVRRECKVGSIESLRWRVGRIELIESTLTKDGSKYTIVPVGRS